MLQATKNYKSQFMKGGMLLFSQTLITKTISFIGQLIVARIMLPEQYGLVALSYTVMSFIDVIQKVGIKEILIQKGKNLEDYINPAFWMSVALGICTFSLTNIAAPFAADFYHTDGIINILRILSVASIFASMQNTFIARLQSEMEFKKISLLSALEGFLMTALTITFAYMGLGAYSLVLPFPIVRIISLLIYIRITRLKGIHWNPEFAKWKMLFNATIIMFAVSFLYAFNESGANLILGKFHDAYQVGIFFFAFTLVSQLNAVIKINLVKIFLPYLAKMEEYQEKKKFFLKSVKNLNFVLTPLFMLISLNAGAFLDMVYGTKWDEAVPVIQVLFIAYSLDICFELTLQFIISLGNYRKILWINTARASLFIITILIGALSGGALAVSVSIFLYNFVLTPVVIFVSLKKGDREFGHIVSAVILPVLLGGFSFGLAYVGGDYLFSFHNPLIRSVVISLMGGVIFLFIFIRWFPKTLKFYTSNIMYFKSSLFQKN